MKKSTWNLITEKYDQRPSYHSNGVAVEDFEKAFANFSVPDDYREFVVRFGGGFIGTYPIYGLQLADSMGTIGRKCTAVEITAWFRERKWPGVEDWLIFSIDQSGNPVGFAADHSVWISDIAPLQVQKLGNDFEDFVLKWCLRVRDVNA
jgi:SMI1 / KNR4 family (SUKH-1)